MPERAITEMNSKQVNETTIRLNAFMRDVKDGNLRTILKNMQSMLDYHAEKIRIYEEHLSELTGKARLELTDSDKRRLAQKGKALNDYLLAAVEPTWAPGTLRGWYNSLVGAKYNSVRVQMPWHRPSPRGNRHRLLQRAEPVRALQAKHEVPDARRHRCENGQDGRGHAAGDA